ncbi:MAG: formylglycine-generating enzyme family protein [Burkholderiales bacterium]|jgi:formylglycine-generating enzyme required for sulfatase activity
MRARAILTAALALLCSVGAGATSNLATETFTVNGVSFQMVRIPSGSFMIGSPHGEAGRDEREGPPRWLRLHSYQLGQTEVTQALWQAVTGEAPDPHHAACGNTCPAVVVSWDKAQAFMLQLNKLTQQAFRLPSEAEWEYAARAGCRTPFNIAGHCRTKLEPGDANYNVSETYGPASREHSAMAPVPVASYPPNAWGLHDMHGNVREWVQDCLGPYAAMPSDGTAAPVKDCEARVLRGGSWWDGQERLRAGSRSFNSPDFRMGFTGLRLVRSLRGG